MGELTYATLDHEFDRDLFGLRLEEGTAYNFKLNHITTTVQPVTLYASDGVTVVYKHSPAGRQITGSYFPWVATGDVVYLEFWSPGGDTGDYTLIVTPADIEGDDHADATPQATEVSIGEDEAGVLDDQNDFDYFGFRARAGQAYELAIRYESLDDPRISLFARDGFTEIDRYEATGRRQSGKYIQWIAPESGEYFIVVWSPAGEVGEYTFTSVMSP